MSDMELFEAKERIAELERELALQKGAHAAQDERERTAAETLGMTHTCDWPEDVMREVLILRYENNDLSNGIKSLDLRLAVVLEERDRVNTTVYVLMRSGTWNADGTDRHRAPFVKALGAWTDKRYAEEQRELPVNDTRWTGTICTWIEEVTLVFPRAALRGEKEEDRGH